MTSAPANKPIIAVDIDEVLVPHFQGLIDWYNDEYGTELTLKHNHPNDPRPWGTPDYGEAVRRVRKYFETPGFLDTRPFREAAGALKKLGLSYRLLVVTGRDTIIERVTRQWLDRHFKDLIEDAHFSARYSLEGKVRDKASVIVSTGADYLIDDDLSECEAAAKAGIRCLLFGEYPWNKVAELPAGITRVKNWQEVLEYFDGR